MAEVQRHGFDFENRVKEKSISDFKSGYTQKRSVHDEIKKVLIVPE